MHRLNAVAALIVELCDGNRSVEQIAEHVAPLIPDGNPAAVQDWIHEAAAKTLLVEAADAVNRGTPGEPLSSEQLAELADRLRELGKIHAAYLCQRRAAEQEPANAPRWSHLGELAHIAGRRDDARTAYEHYLTLQPDDAEVRHLVSALCDKAPPARMPDECVRQLYRRFSKFYDSNLIDDLEYEAPERLNAAIDAALPTRTDLTILDLGCGTGLSGAMLRKRASRLAGIDLSPDMVARARGRKLYDELEVAEITAWLDATALTDRRFELIVACDTLIYFGDLSQVVARAARVLGDDGALAFSVERGEEPPFRLTDSGRFSHHIDHIAHVAAAAGLEIAHHREDFLRMEYGEPVSGHVVVLKPVKNR